MAEDKERTEAEKTRPTSSRRSNRSCSEAEEMVTDHSAEDPYNLRAKKSWRRSERKVLETRTPHC